MGWQRTAMMATATIMPITPRKHQHERRPSQHSRSGPTHLSSISVGGSVAHAVLARRGARLGRERPQLPSAADEGPS